MAFVLVIARKGGVDAGLGGKSGAVVAIAWIPGFSSPETIATGFPRLFHLAEAFFRTWTSR